MYSFVGLWYNCGKDAAQILYTCIKHILTASIDTHAQQVTHDITSMDAVSTPNCEIRQDINEYGHDIQEIMLSWPYTQSKRHEYYGNGLS